MNATTRQEIRIAVVIGLLAIPAICLLYGSTVNALKRKAEINTENLRKIAEKPEWREYRVHYNFGYEWAKLGKLQEAVTEFRFCIDKAPVGSPPWVNSVIMMAVISERCGEHEKANAWYGLFMTRTQPIVMKARASIPGAMRAVRRKAVEKGA